jgi:hypothetical protein
VSRPLLRRNDDGVSEVIGFVLSFALSAVFLLIAMNSFWVAKDNTDGVVTAVELKTIANRVAARIVEAGLSAQEFPNATLNLTVALPQELNGHLYYVNATASMVYVRSTDGTLSASATTFKLDAVTNMTVSGRVDSSSERLVVTYSLQSGKPNIRIHGDE